MKKFLFLLSFLLSTNLFAYDIIEMTDNTVTIKCNINVIGNDGSLIYCKDSHIVPFDNLILIGSNKNSSIKWKCPNTNVIHFLFKTFGFTKREGMQNGIWYKLKEMGRIATDSKIIASEPDHLIPLNIIKPQKGKNIKNDGEIDADIKFKIELMMALDKPSPGSRRGNSDLTVNEIINGNNTIHNWKHRKNR